MYQTYWTSARIGILFVLLTAAYPFTYYAQTGSNCTESLKCQQCVAPLVEYSELIKSNIEYGHTSMKQHPQIHLKNRLNELSQDFENYQNIWLDYEQKILEVSKHLVGDATTSTNIDLDLASNKNQSLNQLRLSLMQLEQLLRLKLITLDNMRCESLTLSKLEHTVIEAIDLKFQVDDIDSKVRSKIIKLNTLTNVAKLKANSNPSLDDFTASNVIGKLQSINGVVRDEHFAKISRDTINYKSDVVDRTYDIVALLAWPVTETSKSLSKIHDNVTAIIDELETAQIQLTTLMTSTIENKNSIEMLRGQLARVAPMHKISESLHSLPNHPADKLVYEDDRHS